MRIPPGLRDSAKSMGNLRAGFFWHLCQVCSYPQRRTVAAELTFEQEPCPHDSGAFRTNIGVFFFSKSQFLLVIPTKHPTLAGCPHTNHDASAILFWNFHFLCSIQRTLPCGPKPSQIRIWPEAVCFLLCRRTSQNWPWTTWMPVCSRMTTFQSLLAWMTAHT